MRGLVELVFPASCVACRAPGTPWCESCRPAGPPFLVEPPSARPGGCADLSIAAAGDYDGGLRAAILSYKERGRRELTRPLAATLVGAVELLDPPPSAVLVGAPSSTRSVRARGHRHMAALARAAARAGGRQDRQLLRFARSVDDSAGLGRDARSANMAGAMVAAPGRGRYAVLVDDVLTTGATLTEAARALADAGWQVHGAAVLAATRLVHES